VELYLANGVVGEQDTGFAPGSRSAEYLNAAGRWANAYAASPANSQDTLNVFDLAPLAHYDLIRVLRSEAVTLAIQRASSIDIPTDPSSLISDLHDQLALAARVAQPDPFRLANVAGNTDTVPHALGAAIQARLYDALTNTTTFESLAQTQLDWALGANAWGSSFVVGAGDSFPNCLAHQVANLSGSLGGRPPLLLGATVDGPNDPASLRNLGAPDGYRKCPADGIDRFRQFDTPQIGYLDDVTSSSTSEPADDYAALALLAFGQAAEVKL
jgi:endoglucanase